MFRGPCLQPPLECANLVGSRRTLRLRRLTFRRGKLLFVRKTINVNSTPIRAFQMVLEQRGLGWKKVMILVRRAPPGETERQAEKKEGES